MVSGDVTVVKAVGTAVDLKRCKEALFHRACYGAVVCNSVISPYAEGHICASNIQSVDIANVLCTANILVKISFFIVQKDRSVICE